MANTAIKKFVVIVPNAAPAGQNILTNYFQNNRFGYWHYGTDTWLIARGDENLNAGVVRDEIKRLLPSISVLVLEVDPVLWAFTGLSKWGEWLRETWE
jgi:hypothetical protein